MIAEHATEPALTAEAAIDRIGMQIQAAAYHRAACIDISDILVEYAAAGGSRSDPLRILGAVAHATSRDHEDNDDCIACVAARPVLADVR